MTSKHMVVLLLLGIGTPITFACIGVIHAVAGEKAWARFWGLLAAVAILAASLAAA